MTVTNLMVMSLDGEITSQIHENSLQRLHMGLTNSDDQSLLRYEIEHSDAVIIGGETVRIEGALLEYTQSNGKCPLWCIYTNKGLDENLRFWKQDKIPRLLVSQKKLKNTQGLENLTYGDSKAGTFLLEDLKKRGVKKILLLGGGHLNRIFYEEDLVDELKLTLAPLMICKGLTRLVSPVLEKCVRFELLNAEAKGNYVFLHYKVTPSRP